VLWTVDGDLAGSRADRFAGRVELFFQAGETLLLVDLRQVGMIDSAGAAALGRLYAAHPGLLLLGRPPAWEDFPVGVRLLLHRVVAAADLESVLAAGPTTGTAPERRRCPRIPLQLPVELFLAGGSAAAALQDISRGGVRLRICGLPAAALHDDEAFDILGLAEDPLGREIVGAAPVTVRAASVRGSVDATVGARFTDSPPPV
jgi:hypothetical protein